MVSGVTTIAVDVVCRTFSKQSRCLLVQSASFRQLPAMPVMCREEQATFPPSGPKWLTYLLRLTVTLEGKMVSDVLEILRLWETMGKVKHARNQLKPGAELQEYRNHWVRSCQVLDNTLPCSECRVMCAMVCTTVSTTLSTTRNPMVSRWWANWGLLRAGPGRCSKIRQTIF